MIDLLRDGVKGKRLSRSDVITGVRQVMLSAKRRGWDYADIQSELMEIDRNNLARQFASGKYAERRVAEGRHPGRLTTKAERDGVLRMHWADIEKFVATNPTWTRDDALDFISVVREELRKADLPGNHRKVMEAALDLADMYGTSQPAVPVHAVEERTGLTRMTAHRILKRLSDEGEWLSLAQRGSGDPKRRRANIYNLAPALAATHKGASPPASQPVPVSHLPVSHLGEDDMATGTLTLTDDEIAVILAMRAKGKDAARHAGEVAIGNEPGDNVTPIRRSDRSVDRIAGAADGTKPPTNSKKEK